MFLQSVHFKPNLVYVKNHLTHKFSLHFKHFLPISYVMDMNKNIFELTNKWKYFVTTVTMFEYEHPVFAHTKQYNIETVNEHFKHMPVSFVKHSAGNDESYILL